MLSISLTASIDTFLNSQSFSYGALSWNFIRKVLSSYLDSKNVTWLFFIQDAFPKGEIYLGTKEKGFAVREGVPPGMKDPGYSFTLKTPDRHFHFSAEAEDDQKEWVAILKQVLQMPLSPQDSSSMLHRDNFK